MLKKVSFVLISSFLIVSNAYAIYEEELLGLIREHLAKTRAPKVQEPPKGVLATVASIPGKVVESAGDGVRYLGDSMRGGDGVLQHMGNVVRKVGEYGSAEIPTLERELRKFWIGAKINSVGLEEIFTSTAYAFCASKELTEDLSAEDGVTTIHKAYQDFITSWNGSSKTSHFRALEKESHTFWFLNGIIRKQARESKEGKPWKTIQDVLTTISLYKIDLTEHPKIKGITEDIVIPDATARKGMDYEKRFETLQTKRLETLLEYIKIKYRYERSLLGYKDE